MKMDLDYKGSDGSKCKLIVEGKVKEVARLIKIITEA